MPLDLQSTLNSAYSHGLAELERARVIEIIQPWYKLPASPSRIICDVI